MEEKETVGTVKRDNVSKLYSQSDIGKITHTSRDRVNRWVKKHKIEGQPAGNAILYPESVLEGYKKYISKPTKQAKAMQKTQAYEIMFKKQEKQIELLKEQNAQFQETNQKLIAQNQQILEAIKANRPQELDYDKLAETIGTNIKIPEIDYDKLSDAVNRHDRVRELGSHGLHHDDYMKQAVETFEKIQESKPESKPKSEDDDETEKMFFDAVERSERERAVEQESLKHKAEDKHDVNGQVKRGASSWFKRLFGDK